MAGTKPIFEGLKGGDAASFGLAGPEINPHRRAAPPQKQILKFKSGLMAPARSTGALAGAAGLGSFQGHYSDARNTHGIPRFLIQDRELRPQ